MATKTKKIQEPSQEEMDKLVEEAAIEHQTQMAAVYLRLRDLAKEIFNTETVSRELLNGLADCCRLPIGEDEAVDEDEVRALRRDLTAAKAWALEVYGEDSPEAVLDAYERGINMDVEEDDEDYEDDDEDYEDD